MYEFVGGAATLTHRHSRTETMPLSVLGPDGKVIISTLPSDPVSGADLFRRLHPLERERVFSDPDGTEGNRLCFRFGDGVFLLYTGMLLSHGVIIAAKNRDISTDALIHAAQSHGFRELRPRRRTKGRVDILQIDEISAASSFVAGVIEIEQLFESASNPDLATEQEVERFLGAFVGLCGITPRINFDGACDRTLLREVDGKALGIIALIASAAADREKEMSVIFREESKRLWVEIEICPRKTITREKTDFDALEQLCRKTQALECKNLSITKSSQSVRLVFSPSVFDPTADGLMQGSELVRKEGKE